MIQLLKEGLGLPFKLYFQPRRFSDEVVALAPDLPQGYSLLQARNKLRADSQFRLALARLVFQSVVSLLWVPVVAIAVHSWGFEVDSDAVATTMRNNLAFGVVGASVFGVAFGVAYTVTACVAFGVAYAIPGGVAFSVAQGVAFGLTYSASVGVREGVSAGVAIGVAAGILNGAAIGLALGVVEGVASSATAFLVATHLWLLPVQNGLSVLGLFGAYMAANHVQRWWCLSPVRWDEVVILPLPGLALLLVALYHRDPKMGEGGITEVAAHRFQSGAATQALVLLARLEAERVSSIHAVGAFHRGVGWLNEQNRVPERTATTLGKLRDVSQEVASALESDSATNRLRRLVSAQRMLQEVRLQAGAEFSVALSRWEPVIAAAYREAEAQQRVEEPIPQVYVSDGRPIRPENRSDDEVTFKGRRAFFRQMEDALGGSASERSTYVLYGQRRTGKSSALYQLPRRLGSQVVPAFVDLQSEKLTGAESAVGFLGGLESAIREEARRHRQLTLPRLAEKELAKDPYPAFGRWLDSVEAGLGDRYLLLCLDEFERIEESIRDGRLDRRVLGMIRSIVQHRRRIAVLLAGSHQIEELPPHWADTLVSTLTLPISFLDETDARELVVEPVRGFSADLYRPESVPEILRLTHRQPYLIQLLCAQLVTRMNEQRRMPPASQVTLDDIRAVIPVTLERGQNHLIDLWRTQTGSDLARDILRALAATPDDTLPGSALRSLGPDNELRDAIATLRRREIIERLDDGRYRITIPLVAEYVRRQRVMG